MRCNYLFYAVTSTVGYICGAVKPPSNIGHGGLITPHVFLWMWLLIHALTPNVGLVNLHYIDVIMGAMASQITSLAIVYSPVYSGANRRKHQSSVSLAFVRGIHRWPVNSPHKGPVTRKMFPFDDVIISVSEREFASPVICKYFQLKVLICRFVI